MNVLIIDDDARWSNFAAALLCFVTGRVRIAATWAEAKVTLDKPNGFDVVMLDLLLPDSTIQMTIDRIPDIAQTGRKVVVMTGHDIPLGMVEDAVKKGAVTVLYKGDINFADKLVSHCSDPECPTNQNHPS